MSNPTKDRLNLIKLKFFSKIRNIIDFYEKIVSPRKELKYSPDYYKSKIFNSFAFFSLIATLFNIIYRILEYIYYKNSSLGFSLIINSIILFFGVLLLFIIGISKYFKLGFYIFPSLPLLIIWTYYRMLKTDLSNELFLINPTNIIILGIIVAGLIMSKKE